MEYPKTLKHATDPAQTIHPNMPNHAADEAAFLAKVDEGLADIDAGRTVPFETVANTFRRKIYSQA